MFRIKRIEAGAPAASQLHLAPSSRRGRLAARLAALGTALCLVAAALAIPATVLAAAPTNDNFVNASSIATFPFADTVDNTGATTEPGEVDACGYSTANSVWYTYAPSADSIVRFDLHGSSFYDQKVDVFQASGPSIGDLSLIGCVGSAIRSCSTPRRARPTTFARRTSGVAAGLSA